MSLVQGPYPTAVPAGQHRSEDDKKREQSCSLVTKLGKEWGPKEDRFSFTQETG